jgi:hypothetical protein
MLFHCPLYIAIRSGFGDNHVGNPDTLIVHRRKPGKCWGRFSAPGMKLPHRNVVGDLRNRSLNALLRLAGGLSPHRPGMGSSTATKRSHTSSILCSTSMPSAEGHIPFKFAPRVSHTRRRNSAVNQTRIFDGESETATPERTGEPTWANPLAALANLENRYTVAFATSARRVRHPVQPRTVRYRRMSDDQREGRRMSFL